MRRLAKGKKRPPNLNKKFYDMTEDRDEIEAMAKRPFIKSFKVRTLFVNDEPDRFNPYLNKLAAHCDEQKAKEI